MDDLYSAVFDMCGEDEADVPDTEVPPNLNATFHIPDKAQAVAQHMTRFTADL